MIADSLIYLKEYNEITAKNRNEKNFDTSDEFLSGLQKIEQFMAIKEDKSFTRTQIGYRSLLPEKGHGVSVSTARCLSQVLDCFIQLSKNTKEENRLSYISRWKRAKA